MRFLRCAALSFALLGAATAAERQAGDTVPLTLKAVLDKVPVGTPITLQGTGPVAAQSSWAAEVTLPDGSRAPVEPGVDAPGRFSVAWPRTDKPGKYRFELKLPAQQLAASAEVEVIGGAAYAAQVQSELGNLMQLLDKLLTQTDDKLAKLPPSPARDDAKARLKKLTEAVQLHKQHQREALTAVDALVRSGKDMPASFGALNRKLSAWEGQSREQRLQTQMQLAHSAADNVACEQMEKISEGLNLARALFNLVGTPFAIAANFAKDVVSNSVAKWASNSLEGQSIAKEWVKNIPGVEPVMREAFKVQGGTVAVAREEALKTIPGLLVDATSYLSQKLFGKYCERFEGPFSAEIEAEFSEAGRRWWTYRLVLEGKLTLRYAKQAPGTALAVNGEFVGQATLFETKEDALAVLFPKLAGSTVKLAQIVDPVAVPYVFRPEGEGKILSTVAVPNSFFIPVKGELLDRKGGGAQLKLVMQPATVDIDASAQVVYMMVSPLTQGIPTWTSFQLPFKPARFVLMRALKGDSVVLDVTRSGQKMAAEGRFQDTRGNPDAHASYKLNVKTCNPDC